MAKCFECKREIGQGGVVTEDGRLLCVECDAKETAKQPAPAFNLTPAQGQAEDQGFTPGERRLSWWVFAWVALTFAVASASIPPGADFGGLLIERGIESFLFCAPGYALWEVFRVRCKNGMANAGFACSMLGIPLGVLGILPLVGLIFSAVGLANAEEKGGKKRAVAGLVVGIVMLVFWALLIVLALGMRGGGRGRGLPSGL